MEQTTRVTKKNFSEYEQKVCQMERRRRKKEAEQKYADIVGGAAFFIATLAATAIWLPDTLPLLGFLLVLLLDYYKLDYYEHWVFLFYLFLAPAVISVAVHLLIVLAVKLTYSGGPDAPLEGSDAERAAALHTRCKEAGYSLDSREKWIYISVSAVHAVILFILLCSGNPPGDFNDIVADLFASACYSGICLLIYIIFNAVLSAFLYRIRQDPDLENDLRVYSELCKKQEQERAEEERKRIKAEEERRRIEKAEQDRRRGDELYRQATAGGAVDEALVRQAADLHSRPACLYMGRQLLEKWSTGSYTKAEKLEIAKEARWYFYIASSEEDSVEAKTEARFGYLMYWTLTKSGKNRVSESKWSDVLSELREIQKSGKLPEQYNEACATLIDSVVDMIDTLAEESASYIYTGTGSTGTWSTSGTGSTSSYLDRDRINDELDATLRGIELSERYGEAWAGYDPEAPGPDSYVG